MVLSIRKISFENEDLAGAGMLWFKDLNEPDPYLILPVTAAMLNYFNLSVSIYFLIIFIARHHERERALVYQQIQDLFQCLVIFPFTVHSHMASRRLPLLDIE